MPAFQQHRCRVASALAIAVEWRHRLRAGPLLWAFPALSAKFPKSVLIVSGCLRDRGVWRGSKRIVITRSSSVTFQEGHLSESSSGKQKVYCSNKFLFLLHDWKNLKPSWNVVFFLAGKVRKRRSRFSSLVQMTLSTRLEHALKCPPPPPHLSLYI